MFTEAEIMDGMCKSTLRTCFREVGLTAEQERKAIEIAFKYYSKGGITAQQAGDLALKEI